MSCRLEVPAVDDDLGAAAVADEVLEVDAVALDLAEGVVEDDVDVGDDRRRRSGLDHVDALGLRGTTPLRRPRRRSHRRWPSAGDVGVRARPSG